MPDIAGRKLGSIGDGNSRDQGVAKLNWTSDALARCSDGRRGAGGSFVDRQNFVSDFEFKHSSQSVFESLSMTPGGESFDSGSQFEVGDRGQPKDVPRLPIDPLFQSGVALGLHQGRDDIGIQNNHLGNFGRRT